MYDSAFKLTKSIFTTSAWAPIEMCPIPSYTIYEWTRDPAIYLNFILYARGLQNTAHESYPDLDDILSIMKK